MKWQEVRTLFPNRFVLVSILDYHEEDDKKIIDEVAPIRAIPDDEANKEFFSAKPGSIVYHKLFRWGEQIKIIIERLD